MIFGCMPREWLRPHIRARTTIEVAVSFIRCVCVCVGRPLWPFWRIKWLAACAAPRRVSRFTWGLARMRVQLMRTHGNNHQAQRALVVETKTLRIQARRDGVKGVVSVSSPFHQLAIGTYMVCDFKSEAVRQGGELRIGRHRLGCDSCGRRCSVWLAKLFVCECVCNPFVGGLVAVAAVGRRCDVFDRSISKH